MLGRVSVIASAERMLVRRVLVQTAKASSTPSSTNPANHIPHATKEEFIRDIDRNRTKFQFDANTGMKPTAMQRHFLVLTRMYRTRDEIPEYVASGTMMRMHNRMRVVFIFAGVAFFYTFFLCFEKAMAMKVHKDKTEGLDVNLTNRARANGNGNV